MALPLPLLLRLRMAVRQKLAVIGVFSLAWITIAMEILRAIETEKALPEATWLYTSLQTEVAVVVASLPAFSFLVSNTENNKDRRNQLGNAFPLRFKGSKARLRSGSEAGQGSQVNSVQNVQRPPASTDEELSSILPSSPPPVKVSSIL